MIPMRLKETNLVICFQVQRTPGERDQSQACFNLFWVK